MRDIQIRICHPGDETALSLIGQATFLETFAGILDGQDILAHCTNSHASSVYRDWLTQDRTKIWLAELNPGSAPVGFMVVAPAKLPLPDLADTDLEIKRIYLLNKFQGGGVGRRLVAEALNHARAGGASRLMLGVYAENESAIGFYARMGFQKLGTRLFKVGGKEYDDHIMGVSLN
jgi:diamine N-acetyltransferase